MRPGVAVGEPVGDAVGDGDSAGVAVSDGDAAGVGVCVTVVTGAHAAATTSATMNNLTELP